MSGSQRWNAGSANGEDSICILSAVWKSEEKNSDRKESARIQSAGSTRNHRTMIHTMRNDAMKRMLKAILDVIRLLLTGKSDCSVTDGICDFSGQGRDGFGK